MQKLHRLLYHSIILEWKIYLDLGMQKFLALYMGCNTRDDLIRQWVPLNVRQKLTVVVGEPIEVKDLVDEFRKKGGDER